MTNDIKQRIEQIKNGKVPEGYHYSRAGISPNDWGKGILSDVLYNEQRAIPKPKEGYWRLGIRSHAKGTFHEYVENPETVDMDELYIVKENDLILNITFAWEHAVALADKDDAGLLVSHRFPTYVFREGQNPIFYKSIAIQKRFKEMLGLISPGGAGRNRVMSKKDFLHLPCNIPSSKEQQKIAEILMQCDKIIELYEKEIEELQKLKKIYLKKMFPRKDTNIPEIRFSEFTEPWKQIKLREMGSLKNGMSFSKDAMDKGYPLVNLQNIFGKNVVDISDLGKAEASEQQLKEYSLEKGDVLFVRSSVKLEGVGEAALVPQTLENTTYSGFVIRFRDEVGLDDDYKRFVFSTKPVRDQIMSQATNSANKNVSQTVLGNLDIPIPKYEEQRKIGDYFKNLDQLIALHQCKLDEKKKHKKSLMQLLLTGIVRVDV